MRRVMVLVALAAAVVAVAWHTRAAAPPSSGVVAEVIDGDTIRVRSGAGTVTVRLLGIDTPETVHPDRPVGCFGPEASAYTKRLLTGRPVTLRYDRELHDRYGRLLAYVYTGGTFANARLVERGYARTLPIPPNTAHAAQLAALERAAALAGLGLWGACG